MLAKLVRAVLSVSVVGVGATACGGGGNGGTGPGPATADLAITVTDGMTAIGQGAPLTYTIVARNNGPGAVTGARVTDTFPAQLTGVTWTCTASTGSSCPASGAGTIGTDVSLPAGGTATFRATGTVGGSGTLVNTATITAPAGVTDAPGNNSATDSNTEITVTADLTITLTDSATLLIDGEAITYTIVVTNLGPSPATGARVDDAFSARVSGVTWTCTASVGSSCPGAGAGAIAANVNLPAGGSVTFRASGTATGTGLLASTATVTPPAGIFDPPANSTATDNDTQVAAAARLRVLHASPEATNLDIVVSGRMLATNLAFKASTAYLTVPATNVTIQARSTGTATVVAGATSTLAAGRDYTFIPTGLAASPVALVLSDTNTAPSGNNGKVRIVHASPGAGTIDIYVWPPALPIEFFNPVIADVTYQTVTQYVNAPAGTYRVRLTPPNTKTALFDSTLTIQAGRVRTGVVVDRPGGGPPVGAVVLADLN